MNPGKNFGLVLMGVSVLTAQETVPQATFRAETALQQIEVRVKNRDGQPVRDLLRQEFSLSENGVSHEIATFEYFGPRDLTAIAKADALADQLPPDTSIAETRIYIATDLAPQSAYCDSYVENGLFFRGVQKFLDERWQPGTEVSFNGTTFTSDRDKLLETFALMQKHPLGRSSPGKKDWLPPVFSGHGLMQMVFECDSWVVSEPSPSDPYSTTERVERTPPNLFLNLGRSSLERYIDLTRKLGRIEGKKIVVLFARGLTVGLENKSVLNRLAREALRARVSFYSVIPTALTAPNGNLTWAGGSARQTRGLFEVAENTGGRAIQNTNDFSDVFERIYQDNSDYYLLGYYPTDRTEQGRFRKIDVSVGRPDLRVESTKGYYEAKPFKDLTEGERRTLLEYQALGDRTYTDFPLTVGLEYFRDEQKQPFLAFSVGIAADRLPHNRSKKRLEVDLKIATGAQDMAGKELAAVREQTIRFTLNPADYDQSRDDPAAVFQFPSTMTLSPGRHDWKLVVRDEHTGKAGSFRSAIEVPTFEDELSPSSLMLTTRMIEEETGANGEKSPGKGDLSKKPPGVTAGSSRFYPQATNTFQRGQRIYVVYELYNVPPEILKSPPGPRVFLLLGETPLDKPPFSHYDVFPRPQSTDLRYVATLETETLRPGEYNLVVNVPRGERAIFKRFTLNSE